jgi:hypothetical protein
MVRQRVRLPLFAYFACVAPVLLGVLVISSALMGPPPRMPASPGAPVLFKRQAAADASVRILTVPPSIPVPAAAVSAGIPQITVTPSEMARTTQAQDAAKKRVARRPAERRDRYAFDPSRPTGAIQ